MSSSQQNKQKTRKQCPIYQRQGFKTAVHKLATLKSLFSNVRIPWCPKKHAKLLSLKKYFIKSEGKTQECLVNSLTFCNVLRKSQKVLIKPTELPTLALSNASLQTLYLFKHWGQRCGVMVGGTRWVYNQNICRCPHFFFLDSTTTATVVKAHD